MKLIHARVPDLLHRQMVRLAKDNRRSLNAETQVALERHLNEQKKEGA